MQTVLQIGAEELYASCICDVICENLPYGGTHIEVADQGNARRIVGAYYIFRT